MKTDLGAGLTADIEVVKVDTDPPAHFYHIVIGDHDSCWAETWVTRELLVAFLRGFEAGAAMAGHIYLARPAIPHEPV